MSHSANDDIQPPSGAGVEGAGPAADKGGWSAKYGEQHRLRRVTEFPGSAPGPKKVRLYARNGHFIAQWWDPSAKTNLCVRINGDLVDALARAREIDRRLADFKTAGISGRRLRHPELVHRYRNDLNRRADAGEISPSSVRRFGIALRHYESFAALPATVASHPNIVGVDRDFALRFAAFLNGRIISPNGHVNTEHRPMKGRGFVMDTVRAMFQWAADPDRGRLLPDGFRNPFLRRFRPAAMPTVSEGEPDITTEMAAELIGASDRFCLPLFAVLLLFGLRAAEPSFLFRENLDDGWLRVPCIPELGYLTKGRRDKRFPLTPLMGGLLGAATYRNCGLFFVRRAVAEGREPAPLLGASLPALASEYRRRLGNQVASAERRGRVRDEVLRDAGALRYDDIQQEFSRLAARLGWPANATLKDLRHLFATNIQNAGVPEDYAKFLMGHALGKAPITAYRHLNRVREQYLSALDREFGPIVDAIRLRGRELGIPPAAACSSASPRSDNAEV